MSAPAPALREFTSVEEMQAVATPEQILEWVNALARQRAAQRFHHKAYQEKRKMMVKAVQEHLSPGELAELKRRAQAVVAGEGEEI